MSREVALGRDALHASRFFLLGVASKSRNGQEKVETHAMRLYLSFN